MQCFRFKVLPWPFLLDDLCDAFVIYCCLIYVSDICRECGVLKCD